MDPLCNFEAVFTSNQTMVQYVGTRLSNQPSDEQLMHWFSHPDFSFHRHWWVQSVLITLYAGLAFLGLSTNVLVVLLIIYHQAIHNITNIFVLALALSDITLCAFNIPLQLVYEIKENLQISESLCKLFGLAFAVPLHVSCLTMMYIAIDRYRIILHPLLPRMTPRCAVALLLGTVAFSLINALPVAWSTTVQGPFLSSDISRLNVSTINAGLHYMYCVEHWSQEHWRLLYSLYNAAVLFLLPLLLTTFLYARVYCRLRGRAFKQRDLERKRRTNRILAAIVVSFALCWTPWTFFSTFLEIQAFYHNYRLEKMYERLAMTDVHSAIDCKEMLAIPLMLTSTTAPPLLNFSYPYSLLASDDVLTRDKMLMRAKVNVSSLSWITPWNQSQYMKFLDMTLKLFALTSSCINPFLYGWLNDSIRESMLRVLRRWQVCAASSDHEAMAGGGGSGGNRNLPEGGERLLVNEEPMYNKNLPQEGTSSRYSPSAFDVSTKRSSLYPSTLMAHSPRNSLLPPMPGSSGQCLTYQQRPSCVGNTLLAPPGAIENPHPSSLSSNTASHFRGVSFRVGTSPQHPNLSPSISPSTSGMAIHQSTIAGPPIPAPPIIIEESSSTTTTQPPAPEEPSLTLPFNDTKEDFEEIVIFVPSFPAIHNPLTEPPGICVEVNAFSVISKDENAEPSYPTCADTSDEGNETPVIEKEDFPHRKSTAFNLEPFDTPSKQTLLKKNKSKEMGTTGKKRTFSITSSHRMGSNRANKGAQQQSSPKAEYSRLARRQTVMVSSSERPALHGWDKDDSMKNTLNSTSIKDNLDNVTNETCPNEVDDFAYFRLIAAEEESKKADFRRNSAEVHQVNVLQLPHESCNSHNPSQSIGRRLSRPLTFGNPNKSHRDNKRGSTGLGPLRA